MSLQLHIVDRSVVSGILVGYEQFFEDRNESACECQCAERETRNPKKNESVQYRQCLFVCCDQPELGSVPKWTSRASKSTTLRPAHHPRKDTRRQGVSRHYYNDDLIIRLIMFLPSQIYSYFFSWRDPQLKGVEEDWLTARNYCRRRCMDSVSLETSLENEWIKQRVVGENVS